MNKYDFSTARGGLVRLATRALELEQQIARAWAQFDETGQLSVEDHLAENLSNMDYALTDEMVGLHSFRLALRREEAVQEREALEAALARSEARVENLAKEVVRLAGERVEMERLVTVQKLSAVPPFFDLAGKIATIRVVRERLNVGLREAKELVDTWPIFWGMNWKDEPRFLTTEENEARRKIHPFDNGQNEAGYYLICAMPGCGKQKDAPIHQVVEEEVLNA